MGGMGRVVGRDRMLKQSIDFRTDVKFKKTGTQIKGSIKSRIQELTTECEKDTTEITKICKLRELDVQEVLDGAHDAELQEQYSTKAYSNAPGRTNSIVKELEADIVKLKQLSASLSYTNAGIENLSRVSNNIMDQREFELSYSELVLFGF